MLHIMMKRWKVGQTGHTPLTRPRHAAYEAKTVVHRRLHIADRLYNYYRPKISGKPPRSRTPAAPPQPANTPQPPRSRPQTAPERPTTPPENLHRLVQVLGRPKHTQSRPKAAPKRPQSDPPNAPSHPGTVPRRPQNGQKASTKNGPRYW